MKTVLIVDDEADIVEVLGHLLGDEGYRVLTAYNGEEALARLRAQDSAMPDLVLLDLMMPVLDGRELVIAMRADERYRSIPVLMMSAGDATSVAKEFSVELIRKPFGLKNLLDRMKRMMERSA